MALALAVRAERVLVARRPAGVHLAGAWEFPGGRIDPGEHPAEAARRELREETGLGAGLLEPLSIFVYDYPDRSIRFHAFLARDPCGEVCMDGPREWAWRSFTELCATELPPANRELLGPLRWRLGREP